MLTDKPYLKNVLITCTTNDLNDFVPAPLNFNLAGR